MYSSTTRAYHYLPVESHDVVIIKREKATQQSIQQHPHAPNIRLKNKGEWKFMILISNGLWAGDGTPLWQRPRTAQERVAP